MKYLSHPRTGCNRRLLLQLDNSFIRFPLDYGATKYSHTNNTALQLLDSIPSGALRLALGALHTSPTLSSLPKQVYPALQFRFLSLTVNFLTSTSQLPQILIFLPSLRPQNSLRLSLEAHLGKHLRLEPLPPIYSSIHPFLLGHLPY